MMMRKNRTGSFLRVLFLSLSYRGWGCLVWSGGERERNESRWIVMLEGWFIDLTVDGFLIKSNNESKRLESDKSKCGENEFVTILVSFQL
jgi:hypothetical protein